jgi:hypothetical protein
MSGFARLFRPGAGQVLQSFTTAVADGVMYPADWVMLSTTVPTSQGTTAGEFEGKTLGTFDYIEAELAIVTGKLGCGGLVLGVVMGKSISSVSNWENVTSAVLADGDVMTIQNWGVHPQVRQAATGLLGDYLYLGTVAGEPLNAVSASVGVDGDTTILGTCLAVSSTYQRATAADQDAGPAFISRLR